MSAARAASRSRLTLGTMAAQRGRTPQFVFMKSRTKSAVVLGSTVTGLSSGAGGAFALLHSVMMSFPAAGSATTAAMTAATATYESLARGFMRFRFQSALIPEFNHFDGLLARVSVRRPLEIP